MFKLLVAARCLSSASVVAAPITLTFNGLSTVPNSQVPEPSSLAFISVAIAALAASRKRARALIRIRRLAEMRLRILFLFAWMVLAPLLASAEVPWHKFGTTDERETFALGRAKVSIEKQKPAASGFPGDELVLVVQTPGRKVSRHRFTSSYGLGSVAVQGKIVLLKYGLGRGTAGARVEHIRALNLDHDLDELVDVQCSYWVMMHPLNVSPDFFEYRLQIQTDRAYTTLSFSLPKPQEGLLFEKIVKLRNGG